MRLGYLYSRYPVLSQTFCDAEMLELERRGAELVLASMYPPKTDLRHEYLAQLKAPIHYAPEKAQLEALVRAAKGRGRWPDGLIAEHERRFGPEYKAALRARNALFFVDLFERENIRHFHVHFTNRAAHTAIFVQAISGIPFSVTAHGQDFMIDLGNAELLGEICARATFVAAETDFSRSLLATRCPASAGKIVRVYNGLALQKFRARASACEPRANIPVRLLSVGRLVEFKGFDILLEACAALRRDGLKFECEIIGDGPLRAELEAQVQQSGLAEQVFLRGEKSQADVLRSLTACDLFVLAAKIDHRGASDVFPTVIAEAMAAGKPVVSTYVAGIPELVAEHETGVLVAPFEAEALAGGIAELIRAPARRESFGRAGRSRIEENFTIEKTIEPLWRLFLETDSAATEKAPL